MLVREHISSIPAKGATMDESDDLSLVSAIADRRDEAAFTELCERFRRRTFSFAFRILCNAALAEDAVQESMLAIWLNAKSFQPERGCVQNWILSIVMNKCVNLKRTQIRSSKREERMAMEQGRAGAATADDIEGSELIATLRKKIDELPDMERMLVACRYCTNMSQQEIAKLVGVSQPTISSRMQQALEHLRASLTAAGVAMVVPLLEQDKIVEALTTGQDCPPGIVEQSLRRVECHEKTVRKLSRNGSKITAAKAIPIFLTAMFVVAGGYWWSVRTQQNSSASATINPGRFYAHWSFVKDQPHGIEVLGGTWQWQPASGKTPAGMNIGSAPCMLYGATVQLPVQISPRPLLATVEMRPTGGKFGFALGWLNDQGSPLPSKGGSPIPPEMRTDKTYTIHFYLTPQFNVMVKDDRPLSIFLYEPTAAQRLSLYCCMNNLIIESIDVRELSPDEIPERFRDPAKLISELNLKPSELTPGLSW